MTNSQDIRSTEEGRSKKTYQSPQLRVYGNIGEITQGTGRRGNEDSANPAGGGTKSLP